LKKEAVLFAVLKGETRRPPPVWLMRQAGRYLSEYRALRERAGSFWKMCMEPKLAVEITLQPVRRFDFDAAIIFSDILVVPRALGVEVEFEEGFGPRLKAITSARELSKAAMPWGEFTSPVYEAISMVRAELQPEKALIGFAGGPWTLATYLAQGHGSDDQRAAKLWGYRDPAGFDALLDKLADSVTRHLAGQVQAGADVVQIFDSWSAGLPERVFQRWVIQPTKKIVTGLRAQCPHARIIGFPRAATLRGYESYAVQTGVDAVSVDTAAPMQWAVGSLAQKVVVQGNLDPIVLLAGGQALADAIDEILEATREIPFIFNLGHGILPETPVDHVEKLVTRIRASH
jgi:uroporphyrinogen decarboxylase